MVRLAFVGVPRFDDARPRDGNVHLAELLKIRVVGAQYLHKPTPLVAQKAERFHG
jgi:hypothetical protein